MTQRTVVYIALLLASVGLSGCSVAPMHEEVNVHELKQVSGDVFHEWSRIYSVISQAGGEEPTRTHVGYLDRRFSMEEPEGKFFVLDLTHKERGFLLPGGLAFLLRFEGSTLVGSEELGNSGIESGIKRILQVRGGIETEFVKDASTEPVVEASTFEG